MEINLTNKMKTLEDGAINNVSFDEYEIYNNERSASTNVRLMCNVNVICDGSLFNPISEAINEIDPNGGKKTHSKSPIIGADNITGTTNFENIKFGADIFDLPSMRAKIQPFLKNQKRTLQNFIRDYNHYVKTANDYWFQSHIGGFTNIGSTLSKFNRNEYASIGETFKNKLIREDGWFGFKNPVSMRYIDGYKGLPKNETLPDYNNNVGLFNEKPGQFIELYPSKELYSYVPIYSKINNKLEYNWLTYLTYPAKNIYDTDYLLKLSNYGVDVKFKRYGLKIWFIDESDQEITLFRTKLKNGFSVGDIVSIYSGNTSETSNISAACVVRAYEIVNKIDDYTFALNMSGKKLLSWNIGTSTTTDFSDTVIRYTNTNNVLTRYVISSGSKVLKTDSANYSNNFAVVKVDNQAECLYYIRTLKTFPNNPIITQNAFSKNAFGMDSASVLFPNDIDISEYKDNLGRPLTDIFLTSIKNNKGYGQWYSYRGSKQVDNATTIEGCAEEGMPIEESRAFGEVDGAFMMDDNVCYSADTAHENSIRNISNGEGRAILTERDGVIDAESKTLEFYCDLCEYSINSFKERSLQSFMHRFNTAQRESFNNTFNYLLRKSMFGVASNIVFRNGNNTPSKYGASLNNISVINTKPLSSSTMTNGYYYQPHHKIRIRTHALDLSSKNAEKFRVIEIIKSGTTQFTYDTISYSGYSCTLSIENIENLTLNMPLLLYFQHVSPDIEQDYMFNGRLYNRYNDTLYAFMLDDKSFKTQIEMCISGFKNKTYKAFILKRPSDIPSQAIILKDRSFSYIWRDIIPNGFDADSSIEEYPFANNAFYIERNINLYLRRQREVYYEDSENNEVVNRDGEYCYIPETEDVDEVNTTPSANNYENMIKEIEEC